MGHTGGNGAREEQSEVQAGKTAREKEGKKHLQRGSRGWEGSVLFSRPPQKILGPPWRGTLLPAAY